MTIVTVLTDVITPFALFSEVEAKEARYGTGVACLLLPAHRLLASRFAGFMSMPVKASSSMGVVSSAMLPICLVLIWVSTAIAQRFNAPSLGTEFAAAILGVPLLIWALKSGRMDRSRLTLAAIAAIPVLFMFVASIRTASPIEAVLGDGPLWQGWVLWATALGWFWAALIGGDGGNLKRLARALVWTGSITAVWALAEAGGIFGTYQLRTGLAAMAMFDSPLSMGQALVLTITATVSLAVSRSATPKARLTWWLLALLQFSGLIAGGARAAIVGVVVGAAALGVLDTRRTARDRWIRVVSAAVLVTFVIGLAGVALAWSGALGHDRFVQANHMLSDRFDIWRDVGERMKGHSALGTGLRPFDSLLAWEVSADGAIAAEMTYDQHSILLTWLMSTGWIGFIAFGSAAVVVGTHIVRSANAEKSTMSARVLASGGLAVLVSMLTSWPEPVAVLGVSLMAGALVSNGALRHPEVSGLIHWSRPVVAVPALGACAAALITVVALVPAVYARVNTANAADYPQLVSKIEQALVSTHDYSYLTHELTLIERQGPLAVSDAEAIQMLREMAASYPPGAAGRVEVPLLALDILYERSASMSSDEFWRLSRFYANKGIEADANSAVWKYELARAAYVAHRADTRRYVAAALKADPPQSAAIYLRHIR